VPRRTPDIGIDDAHDENHDRVFAAQFLSATCARAGCTDSLFVVTERGS